MLCRLLELWNCQETAELELIREQIACGQAPFVLVVRRRWRKEKRNSSEEPDEKRPTLG